MSIVAVSWKHSLIGSYKLKEMAIEKPFKRLTTRSIMSRTDLDYVIVAMYPKVVTKITQSFQ